MKKNGKAKSSLVVLLARLGFALGNPRLLSRNIAKTRDEVQYITQSALCFLWNSAMIAGCWAPQYDLINVCTAGSNLGRVPVSGESRGSAHYLLELQEAKKARWSSGSFLISEAGFLGKATPATNWKRSRFLNWKGQLDEISLNYVAKGGSSVVCHTILSFRLGNYRVCIRKNGSGLGLPSKMKYAILMSLVFCAKSTGTVMVRNWNFLSILWFRCTE